MCSEDMQMSITVIGTFQYKHYQRLKEGCKLMSCSRAGVNVDYFTLLVRLAGLTAVPYSREVGEDPEYLDFLGNGTVDVGFALRRMDPALLNKVNFALPITGVTYGYLVKEDRTEIRDSFMNVISASSTLLFVAFIILANLINCFYSGLDVIKEVLAKPEVKSLRCVITETYNTYCAQKRAKRLCFSLPLSSRVLLFFYFPATIVFATIFQSQITSILVSDKVRGYDVTSFSKLLDKLEWEDYRALIWPYFRLNLYCRNDECARWKSLQPQRTISMLDKNEEYFKQLSQNSKFVGFTSIGDELLRSDVIVYNRRERLLFIADQTLCEQPFSFMISKKRRDLVEAFNRAIAITSSVYPRMMTRYMSPYGVYSKKIKNMEVSSLKLSNFDSIWPFFAICLAIIVAVFIAELIVGKFICPLK